MTIKIDETTQMLHSISDCVSKNFINEKLISLSVSQVTKERIILELTHLNSTITTTDCFNYDGHDYTLVVNDEIGNDEMEVNSGTPVSKAEDETMPETTPYENEILTGEKEFEDTENEDRMDSQSEKEFNKAEKELKKKGKHK